MHSVLSAFFVVNCTNFRRNDEMNEKKIKCKTIFSQKLAGYLLMRGFVLAESRKDYKNPERNLFFFFESPELMEAITDYTNNQKR
jgi:hypothetical protein